MLCTNLLTGRGINQDAGDALGGDEAGSRFFWGSGLGMLGGACVRRTLHVREGGWRGAFGE